MDESELNQLRRFREFVADQDVVCPGCGVNLRGVTWPACPGCGQELELAVRLVEPRQASFVAGLVGLAGGLTFYAVVVLYVVWMYLRNAGYSLDPNERLILATAPVALVAGTGAWVRFRGWLRRKPPGARAGLAAACWMLSLSSVWVFFRLN